MSANTVTRPGSTVVHLALLWNVTPLCNRNRDSDWDVTTWQGITETRTLCRHCCDVLDSLGNFASLYRGRADR